MSPFFPPFFPSFPCPISLIFSPSLIPFGTATVSVFIFPSNVLKDIFLSAPKYASSSPILISVSISSPRVGFVCSVFVFVFSLSPRNMSKIVSLLFSDCLFF